MHYRMLLLSIFLLATGANSVAAQTIPVQQYDIAEIMMNKYKVRVGDDEFTLFYRISMTGAVSEDTHEDLDAKITSITVNQERQSLVIKLENVAQVDIMSMRIPKELISAEGKQLALFIDGKETQYEWSVKENYNNLIFIVPPQTTDLEIVGTRVIPEFSSALLALIAASAIVMFRRYVYS